jgi:hypothetical protein
MPLQLKRRDVLKFGAAGSAALATAGLAATLSGCARTPAAAQGFLFLSDADVELFRALIPAVIAGALPAEAAARDLTIAETLRRIDGGCFLAGSPARGQLRQLFDLLNFRPTRALAAGVHAPWPEVDVEQASAFLARWRDSSIGLFNGGYRVLVKLVASSFYGQPVNWHLSGYPGPLAFVYQAVNS